MSTPSQSHFPSFPLSPTSIPPPDADDVKAALAYDWHKKAATGAVTLNKAFDNGSSLELKATYRQAQDALILDETWRLDANNKLVGSYNFKSEEAVFGYTYTQGDWAATGRYNFQRDATVLEVEKKQGKARLSAVYHPADGVAALNWNQKPYKATLRGTAGKGGVSAQGVIFAVTHEFEL
jgi:hypothetical protein